MNDETWELKIGKYGKPEPVTLKKGMEEQSKLDNRGITNELRPRTKH